MGYSFHRLEMAGGASSTSSTSLGNFCSDASAKGSGRLEAACAVQVRRLVPCVEVRPCSLRVVHDLSQCRWLTLRTDSVSRRPVSCFDATVQASKLPGAACAVQVGRLRGTLGLAVYAVLHTAHA